MKKKYLILGLVIMLFASCSTDEQAGTDTPGSQVTLSASITNNNSSTRVVETVDNTNGLLTDWSSEDSLDVLVNAKTLVPMGRGTGNKFTATTTDQTVTAGFNAGNTIYGVNNKCDDNITTSLNGIQLNATVDFTGQDGTVDNLKKYDLMYGKGDPAGNVTFNHKVCILRLDINSDSLKADGITSITGMTLQYAASSGTKLFASQKTYDFGVACDSTVTDADVISLSNTNITVTNGEASVYIAIPHREKLSGTLYIHLTGSNGTTSTAYYLTSPITLSNKSFMESTVQSKTITGLSRSARIGDYLFSDGTWGSLVKHSGSTPIAVIFSSTTSVTDKGHGWTHGYAMALRNAATSVAWDPKAGEVTPNPTGTFITTTAAIIADKDGYTHTTYLNSSIYPAAYAVATSYKSTVAAPTGTSGWYLPSIGQWYDVCVNLGKMGSYTRFGDEAGVLAGLFCWPSAASTCITNLNAYLTPLIGVTYNAFSLNSVYWSSSEFNSDDPEFVVFDDNEILYIATTTKAGTHTARGVIAF